MSQPGAGLPSRPSLDQLKKQAKDLRASGGQPTLVAAQRAVAQQYGYASWPKLKRAVELRTLRRLIEEDAVAEGRRLLERTPALAAASFDDGAMPLHLAAGENQAQWVRLLIEYGAPMHPKFMSSGHSALSWAVTCWAFDAAHALVELGDRPDLFCAAGLGLIDVVKGCWKEGVLQPRPSRTGSSRYSSTGERLPCPPPLDPDHVSDALYIACRCERVEVARWLLDHGADPNWRGYAGATCLAWAEFSGNVELCALLRTRGGSDELRDQQYGATPRAFALMVLAGWGFPKLLIERLTRDRSLASLTGDRGSLLHAAAESGQLATTRILLQFGADASVRDPQGRTPADVAQEKGHAAIAELLSPSDRT